MRLSSEISGRVIWSRSSASAATRRRSRRLNNCYGGDGKPYETIMELQRRLRCRECDERGKVVVSVRWEMGSAILC